MVCARQVGVRHLIQLTEIICMNNAANCGQHDLGRETPSLPLSGGIDDRDISQFDQQLIGLLQVAAQNAGRQPDCERRLRARAVAELTIKRQRAPRKTLGKFPLSKPISQDGRQQIRPAASGLRSSRLPGSSRDLIKTRGSTEAGHARSHRERAVAADHFRDGAAALGNVDRGQGFIQNGRRLVQRNVSQPGALEYAPRVGSSADQRLSA